MRLNFPQLGRWLPALALTITMIVPTGSEAAQFEELCEKQWILDSGALASGAGVIDAKLLGQWRTHEAQCGSTSIYWGRLAMIHILLNDLPAARVSLARAPHGGGQYGYAVDAAKAQLAVQERMNSPQAIGRGDLLKFEAAYAAIVKKYPHWPTGYALLGGTQTLLAQHEEAVRSLKVATKGDAYQLSGVYRNLTISLSALGQHDEALQAADKAMASNKALVGDPSFACAAAVSHAALGYLEDAADILKVIAAKRPQVQHDPEYLRAVEFYKARQAKAVKPR